MNYYLIYDINVDVGINALECQLAAEHLGWKESETYAVAEENVEKAEKVIEGLRFLSTTNDEERVIDKIEAILRKEHDIDTDLITIEAGYGDSFECEELNLDGDNLQMENQCDHCGELVNGEMHIKDYFAGRKPICPVCGKPYTPCNECMWDEDCDNCPFTSKKGN